MGRESDNFTAEVLLKQLGALYARLGHDRGRGGVVLGTHSPQADVPLTGVRFADGSGSRGSTG